jgi:hypothetical protein
MKKGKIPKAKMLVEIFATTIGEAVPMRIDMNFEI